LGSYMDRHRPVRVGVGQRLSSATTLLSQYWRRTPVRWRLSRSHCTAELFESTAATQVGALDARPTSKIRAPQEEYAQSPARHREGADRKNSRASEENCRTQIDRDAMGHRDIEGRLAQLQRGFMALNAS